MFYENDLWKENFEVLLRIDLVDICSFFNKASEINFYQYCVSKNLSQCKYDEKVICETLNEKNEKGKLLWILDGFDELELMLNSKNSDTKIARKVHELILENSEKRLLKYLMITSRPGFF